MTKTTKMTKRDYFNILRASYPTSADNYADVIAFIDHELELLERKNNAIKKPSAKQEANKDIKASILEQMEDDKQYTISEMMKELPILEGLSNQRVSALVRQLKLDGSVIRTEDKRKAYFSKA